MIHWLLTASMALTVFSQESEIIYDFSLNKIALSNCVENYLLNSSDPFYKEGVAKTIADSAAARFYGKTKTRKDLNKATNQLFRDLKYRKPYIFRDFYVYNSMRLLLREALVNCDFYRTDPSTAVPVFTGEPEVIGALLNYILVDWPIVSLYDMIHTHNGRALLRRYAEDAGVKLAYALNSVMDHDYFRYLLRSYWMLRALDYFNGNNGQLPFFRYRYSKEYPFPHTYDNQTFLESRGYCQLWNRNPKVTQRDFNKIMYIHAVDRPGYGEADIFSAYESNGTMSVAQYYIETHIDQFYRIIFFFLELQIYGISSDEEDIYDGPLPVSVVPIEIQAIFFNDHVYRKYLMSLRERLETAVINNPQFQIQIGNSLSSARAREEDLVSLLSLWIYRNVAYSKKTRISETFEPVSTTFNTAKYDQLLRKDSNMVIWNISTSTTFASISTTTSKYEQFKNKDSDLVRKIEKQFFSESEATFTGEEKQRPQNNDKKFGYSIYYGNITNRVDFLTEELLSSIKKQSGQRLVDLTFQAKCILPTF